MGKLAIRGAVGARWGVAAFVGLAVGLGGELDSVASGQAPVDGRNSEKVTERKPEGKAADKTRPGAAPLERLEAEILFRDGRKTAGVLVEQDDRHVVLLIAGIETTFERREIERMRLLPSIVEQYLSLKAAIDPKNVPARLQLVRWLMERDCYDTALIEVRGALEVEPGDQEALELQRLVTKQRELRARSANPKEKEDKATEPTRPKSRARFPLLTKDDINTIRVFELDLADPPRISVQKDVVERFLEKYAGQEGVPATREGRDAFVRKPAAEIVRIMFRLRAREFYDGIRVLENPTSMRMFRDSVHRPWLLSGCGTSECHGGEEAGKLQLASRRNSSEAIEYTNFYILDQFRLADGTPLIDYLRPERSPLLQMGLPRDLALHKHPEVTNIHGKSLWRPVFNSPDDQRFKDAMAWIDSMYTPRVVYPIKYTPPGLSHDSTKDPNGRGPATEKGDAKHDDTTGAGPGALPVANPQGTAPGAKADPNLPPSLLDDKPKPPASKPQASQNPDPKGPERIEPGAKNTPRPDGTKPTGPR